jgi:hypothetical protein
MAADWTAVKAQLDDVGCAPISDLLDATEIADLVGLYDCDDLFRSVINMRRYRFGEGEYKYFDYPLPAALDGLRHALYARLLPIAQDWFAKLGRPTPWPDDLDEWLARCHAAGQARPTPLVLKYGPGDWNALHRDMYGELFFPLQVVINLTDPQSDYTGGEFVLVEQRPRAQSRPTVVQLPQGHGLVFTTQDRPVKSARGWAAAPVRHGVSVVRSGHRMTLGLLFHDAP